MQDHEAVAATPGAKNACVAGGIAGDRTVLQRASGKKRLALPAAEVREGNVGPRRKLDADAPRGLLVLLFHVVPAPSGNTSLIYAGDVNEPSGNTPLEYEGDVDQPHGGEMHRCRLDVESHPKP